MMDPLVSVIIPAYNREHTVGRSIDSVLAQTYPRIEIIVVDDGSTDGTVSVLEEYGDAIQVLKRSNGGPSAARNAGAAASRGDIIAFLDSDDTWTPGKIGRQVKLLASGGTGVPCCICNASVAGGEEPMGTSFANAGVECELEEGFWMNPAPLVATRFILFNQVVAIRREAFELIGGFKEHMRLLEDHDIAFRLSLLGPWAFVSEPMVEKFNGPDGLGVQAMKDPAVHAKAWSEVLKGFLAERLHRHRDVERIVLRALDDVGIEIRAVELMRRGGLRAMLSGRVLMLFMRTRGKVRRRLPGWPRVIAVPALNA